MGLSLDTPINFDVLLINTFITQLPVVFGELGCVSLAGVFERRFVISIATFELWFRETIVVFLGMIWGTDRCFVNNTLYSRAVSFQRAVFRFITVAGTWWGDNLFFRLQDLMVMVMICRQENTGLIESLTTSHSTYIPSQIIQHLFWNTCPKTSMIDYHLYHVLKQSSTKQNLHTSRH